MRGQKGERGSRGPPGESMVGLPGLPGAAGVVDGGLREEQMLRSRERGPPGPPGVCLCNISQIINSYNDLIEPSYRYSGSSYGSSDIDFIPGRKGERGELGPKGPPGSPGPKGEQGDRGLPGPPGTPGPPGPMGGFSRDESGTEVDSPLETRSWKLGVPGPKGDTGLPGENGDKGEGGTKGAKGDRGFVGMQGVKGVPGVPGLDGLSGLPGSNGRPGGQGEKGDSGSPGPPGPPGTAFEMISVKEDGTVLSVARGEAGPKGDKGEKGSSGDRGEPGETGTAGIPGPRGPQGQEGPKGETGPAGLVGSTGSQGPKGDRGPPGPSLVSDQGFDLLTIKGEKGEAGKRGRRGRPGPQGPPGLPAPTEIMMKGEKGERGRDGSPGPAGVPGLPAGSGVQYVPVPGPPGPPGPPGTPGGAIPATGSQPFRPKFKDRSPFDRLSGHLGSLEELKALNELKQLKEDRFHRPPPSSRRQYNDTKVVPGAVTFQTKAAMSSKNQFFDMAMVPLMPKECPLKLLAMKPSMSLVSPVGTLAYVIDEEALLVRVRNGWQYVALGSLVPVTTEAPPSSTPSDHHHHIPAFETSSLLNLPTLPEAPQTSPRMLRMVALNEPFAGDLKGQADYQCYRQARRAGLKGDFRAFLSSRVQNINTLVRFSDRDLPIVNLKGDVLFNSWQDLFNGDGAYFPQPPRIYSFSGKNILTDLSWPNKYMWHGSLTTGERAMDLYCDAWDSDSRDRVGLASPLARNKLLGQERFPCDQQLAVLCIETDSPPLRARRRRSRQRGND